MRRVAELQSAFWRDPALPFIESRQACDSRACYKPHSHPTFSIGAVDRGRSLFTGAGQGQVRLEPGTLVFVPARRMHACNPEPGKAWSYQMLHLDAGWLQALRHESGHSTCDNEPVRISRDGQTYQRLCQLNQVLFSTTPAVEKEAALIEFLGDFDADTHPPLAHSVLPPLPEGALKSVVQCLHEGAHNTLSLGELAELAGMGRYQLIRAFRTATGFTPHAFQLNQRVNLARGWLREGKPVADVAYRLGFADQSHFQRVFKAYTGVTPGHYRS
ncbi:AraC family transcriptional regulator [Pseudomonas sp. GD03860]|uniref:AraC family transcriptional regulator n=1 Tax=Pseudomonas TaxID=286 RepID=UPI002363AFF1|nr:MULTISPECIES: AraC family transcriptional regulator [Pseudomonas]MDD2058274.1 AraC family transcriptional regulator [Pseudomonas putida]MDH0636207.1 AraC family transcriptional regulator [Pseudomonas sp. GD03860]